MPMTVARPYPLNFILYPSVSGLYFCGPAHGRAGPGADLPVPVQSSSVGMGMKKESAMKPWPFKLYMDEVVHNGVES